MCFGIFFLFFFFSLVPVFSETWRTRSTACLHQSFFFYAMAPIWIQTGRMLWSPSSRGKEPRYLSSFSIIITKTPTTLKYDWLGKITENNQLENVRKPRSSVLFLFSPTETFIYRSWCPRFVLKPQPARCTRLTLAVWKLCVGPSSGKLTTSADKQEGSVSTCVCVCVCFCALLRQSVILVAVFRQQEWPLSRLTPFGPWLWPRQELWEPGEPPGATRVRTWEVLRFAVYSWGHILGGWICVKNKSFTVKNFWIKWKGFFCRDSVFYCRTIFFFCLLGHFLAPSLFVLGLPGHGGADLSSDERCYVQQDPGGRWFHCSKCSMCRWTGQTCCSSFSKYVKEKNCTPSSHAEPAADFKYIYIFIQSKKKKKLNYSSKKKSSRNWIQYFIGICFYKR